MKKILIPPWIRIYVMRTRPAKLNMGRIGEVSRATQPASGDWERL